MTRFLTLCLLSTGGILALAAMQRELAVAADDSKSAVGFLSAENQSDIGPEREVIQERFPNGRVRIEREVIQDDDKNYINHGSWRMADQEGRKVAHGHYRHGQRHGIWTAWYFPGESSMFSEPPYEDFTGPFISQAHFQDGRLDGVWIIFDVEQRKISQWSYLDGERHGKWTWWYPNGKKLREHTYHNGDIVGQTVVWNPKGLATFRETFEEGRKLAADVEYYESGRKKSKGTYLLAQRVAQAANDWWNAKLAKEVVVGKDEKHGPWRSWYENGQKKMEGHYRHDTEVGTFRWWHRNGQQSIVGEFLDGRESGKWTWWHPNGQKLSQGFFNDGDETGKWTYWAANGKVTERADFSVTEVHVVETPTNSVEIESALPTEKRSTGTITR